VNVYSNAERATASPEPDRGHAAPRFIVEACILGLLAAAASLDTLWLLLAGVRP